MHPFQLVASSWRVVPPPLPCAVCFAWLTAFAQSLLALPPLLLTALSLQRPMTAQAMAPEAWARLATRWCLTLAPCLPQRGLVALPKRPLLLALGVAPKERVVIVATLYCYLTE